MSFDRGDFCRLIFKVHESVLVTDGNLYRRNNKHHPHGHREHRAHGRRVASFEQMPCPGCPDEQRHGEISRDRHVREAVREGRIEDDLQPIDGYDTAIDYFEALRCLHPAIEARIQNAEMSVPVATMIVARKCRPGPTLFHPNSITPRNPASRKKAVSTS